MSSNNVFSYLYTKFVGWSLLNLEFISFASDINKLFENLVVSALILLSSVSIFVLNIFLSFLSLFKVVILLIKFWKIPQFIFSIKLHLYEDLVSSPISRVPNNLLEDIIVFTIIWAPFSLKTAVIFSHSRSSSSVKTFRPISWICSFTIVIKRTNIAPKICLIKLSGEFSDSFELPLLYDKVHIQNHMPVLRIDII